MAKRGENSLGRQGQRSVFRVVGEGGPVEFLRGWFARLDEIRDGVGQQLGHCLVLLGKRTYFKIGTVASAEDEGMVQPMECFQFLLYKEDISKKGDDYLGRRVLSSGRQRDPCRRD